MDVSKLQNDLFLIKILFSINCFHPRRDGERGWCFINYILVEIFISVSAS
mgnify:CR=1 FL=1